MQLHRCVARLLSVLLGILASVVQVPAYADLQTPAWFNAGVPGQHWHYRVPIQLPAAAAPGSTIVLDVDFNALLTSLGVNAAAVDFDENSPRVVQPGGSLVASQEFTDNRFAGVLDTNGNARGEIRFLLPAVSGVHYLYFDIAANGNKSTNPATPINGHFEHSAGTTPTGWSTSTVNAGSARNNEVRYSAPGNTLNLAGGCGTNAVSGINNAPNTVGGLATGRAWHLLGFRDRCEDGTGIEQVRLSREIPVPTGSAAGTLDFHFQLQGWDGIQTATNYDWVVFSVNGTPVNHTTLAISNTGAPALVIEANRLGRSGYSDTYLDFGWKQARLNLSAWAGQTVTFRVETRHSAADNTHRMWLKLDDVQWSRQSATLLAPEAFGVNVVLPADTAVSTVSTFSRGQRLGIRAIVDSSASSVLALLFNPAGTQVGAAMQLFDDGSHGDASAGDRVWTNDGSVAAHPTHVFSGADMPGTNWLVRVQARDASTSAGGTPGLLRRPGQPLTPVNALNYWNIDEQTFRLGGALLQIGKTVRTILDPTQPGGEHPKSVPGSWLQYRLRVENTGPDASDPDSISIVDTLPAHLALCVSPLCTCANPGCVPSDPVSFDESASPTPSGLTFVHASDVTYSLDGVSWSYVPTPDAAGFDPQIRYVRIVPGGAMNPSGGAGHPAFELRYVTRLH